MGPSLRVGLGSGCVALGSSPSVLGAGCSPSPCAGEDDNCVKLVVSQVCGIWQVLKETTCALLLRSFCCHLGQVRQGSASVYPQESTFVLKDAQHRSMSL